MMPSLFRESAVTPPMEQDRRSPSSEGNDTDGLQDGGLPERLRELYLDVGSFTSGTAVSGEDDDGSISSQEAPLPKTQPIDPNHNNFLERYRHENKWFELKNKPIPSTRPELDEWVEEWANAYDEGFRLEIPRFFSDGSRMAILDLMAAFKLQDAETYEISFLKEYTVSVEESDVSEEFGFDHILGRITKFWPEVKKNAKVDGEKNDRAKSDVLAKRATRLERRKIYYDWIALKDSDIPSTRRDLKTWLDRWRRIYYRAVDVNFPYFIYHESLNPKADFVHCFDNKPEWVSFRDICSYGLYSNHPKDSFDAILARFQYEWLQRQEAEEEKLKCVCGLKNHQKWSECYYLNELIRPEGWIPKSMFMTQIDEKAQNDKKLKKFIQNHKKKQLPPPPPKQEEPKKDEDEEQQEENQGPIRVGFPDFKGTAMENNEKMKTSFFVLNNTPYHICNDRKRFTNFKQRDPTLLQNTIHCTDPVGTIIGIHGVGEVKIQVTAPDGKEEGYSLRLLNVKYCPLAPCNAVSTQRFNTRRLYLDKEKLVLYCIKKDNERKDFAKLDRFHRIILEHI
jgi:hypothetical protein